VDGVAGDVADRVQSAAVLADGESWTPWSVWALKTIAPLRPGKVASAVEAKTSVAVPARAAASAVARVR
jgi:hypothetical protein